MSIIDLMTPTYHNYATTVTNTSHIPLNITQPNYYVTPSFTQPNQLVPGNYVPITNLPTTPNPIPWNTTPYDPMQALDNLKNNIRAYSNPNIGIPTLAEPWSDQVEDFMCHTIKYGVTNRYGAINLLSIPRAEWKWNISALSVILYGMHQDFFEDAPSYDYFLQRRISGILKLIDKLTKPYKVSELIHA